MSDHAAAGRHTVHLHGRAPFADHPDRACADEDWRLFFPGEGRNSRPARAVCRRCPFKDECREWAIVHQENAGVWGGTTPDEREAIRKRRARERGGRAA